MKRKKNVIKNVFSNKIFGLVKFFLFALLLCGCGQQKAKESELTMQLCETEAAANSVYDKISDVIESDTPIALTESAEEDAQIYVYVCGAVNNPGVYQMAEGSRLFELIEMAGGFKADADKVCLNLARIVADGEQIVIFTMEETAALMEQGIYSINQSAENESGVQDNGLVNINTASITELTMLSGIGETRAQAIVAYREANGAFESIEDIKNVDGIKDGLFSKIKDKIKVKN